MSTNTTPKISVIMSVYNCEGTIIESINSILNQTFQDFEFLIADDCSTDNSRTLIESIKDRRIILSHNNKNCHYLQTWNRLAALAKAPYITFQDADDISYLDRLDVLYNKMLEDESCAIVGANFYRPYKRWLQSTQSNYKLSYEEIMDDIDKHEIVNFYGTRSLFAKSIFNKMGGFRPFFDRMGWEDYDLFLRIAEQYKVCNVSDVLYEYRYYSTSSSKIKKSNISAKKIFIEDIGFFLHRQRMKNNGLDGLMEGGNKIELQIFMEKLHQFYLNDISLPFIRIAKNQISNKDFSNALKSTLLALKIKFLKFDNLKLPLFLIAAFTRAWIKYLLIIFKLTNNKMFRI